MWHELDRALSVSITAAAVLEIGDKLQAPPLVGMEGPASRAAVSFRRRRFDTRDTRPMA